MTGELTERSIHCPYCGETLQIVVDASGGSQSYVEDCQVCCQPMQITIDVDDGELQSLRVDR